MKYKSLYTILRLPKNGGLDPDQTGYGSRQKRNSLERIARKNEWIRKSKTVIVLVTCLFRCAYIVGLIFYSRQADKELQFNVADKVMREVREPLKLLRLSMSKCPILGYWFLNPSIQKTLNMA